MRADTDLALGRSRLGRVGISMLEVLIVVALVATLVMLVISSSGLVGQSSVKGEALKFSGLIRHVYHQAVMNNQTFQVVLDLDSGAYRVEQLEISGGLSREELAGQQVAALAERSKARSRRVDEEDRRFTGIMNRTPVQGMLIQETQFPEDVRVVGVMTSHHDELQTEGVATINFFPSGFVEQSVIYFGHPAPEDEGGERDETSDYTLIIHPMTGHTGLEAGRVEVDEAFFEEEVER